MDIKEVVIQNHSATNIRTSLMHLLFEVSLRALLSKLIGSSEVMLQLGYTDQNYLFENLAKIT